MKFGYLGFTNSAEAFRKEANINPANVRKANADFKTPGSRKLSRDFDLKSRTFLNGTMPPAATPKIKFSRGNYSNSSPVVPKNINMKKKLQNGEMEIKHELTSSLGEIVQFWLREQHSKCRHPVLTVPEFSLYKPHKCPNPRKNTVRVQKCTVQNFGNY